MTAETAGTLLGGRVRYTQFAAGYRTGIEPVLLAAFVPAEPGARVIEAGTGAGAGLLCLAHRVPLGAGLGIERDPSLAALAARNFAENGHTALRAVAAGLETWTCEERFDHGFANPPWHDPAGTPSPEAGRESAKRASAALAACWARCLAAALRPGGTLAFILPAAQWSAAAAAFAAAGLGALHLLPLWPKAGAPAKLMLLRGTKGARGTDAILPGCILHEADGGFTADAARVLRDGAEIPKSGYARRP